MKIVAAYPGGSPDIPDSRDRVKGYTEQLRGMGVEIVGSIDELLKRVDVVLLESVDGRPHLAQARPVIAAGKPLFIDKPMAASLADAMEIFRLAKEKNVPCFSASSLRFSAGFQAVRSGSGGARRSARLRRLGPDAPRAAPSRPVLVRHPRRGDPFHDHGAGLRDGDPRRPPDKVVGVWKDGRSGTFVAEERLRGHRSKARKGAARRQVSRAMSRWWSRSSSSSRPANRPSTRRRRWKSSPSWKRPMRANAKAASRSRSKA